MSSELMQYVQGTAVVRKQDRVVAAKAQRVHDEVRLKSFAADGALALAGHIMDGVIGLDDHRRSLAQGDPVKNSLLAEIEQEAIQSVKSIQRDLYSGWQL